MAFLGIRINLERDLQSDPVTLNVTLNVTFQGHKVKLQSYNGPFECGRMYDL